MFPLIEQLISNQGSRGVVRRFAAEDSARGAKSTEVSESVQA